VEEKVAAQPVQAKQHDIVDYALITAFIMSLAVILTMGYQERAVPDLLQKIFEMSALSLGFKKALPTVKA